MHPAKSVIAFTTASGAGYGLFFWLGILTLVYGFPQHETFSFVAIGTAFILILFGLLSSTLHLGHPERAWRALSQWRSSWLSREGVLAVFTFIPMSLFALGGIFQVFTPEVVQGFGLVASLCALITVYCTAMIYASLKAIPNWHTPLTVLGYLTLSLASGSLLLLVLASLWELPILPIVQPIVLISIATALVSKAIYWRHIQTKPATSTAESATGLGRYGKVRMFESPHSSENYLLKEMGFQIARKHAASLKKISIILGFLLPLLLLVFVPQHIYVNLSILASFVIGLVTERWLFFAEAEHSVTLFYGQETV